MPRRIVLCAAFAFATFALMLGGHNAGSARAGTAAPNVDGKWEGTWMHPAGSGQISWSWLKRAPGSLASKVSLP
jgi:hypothetical protein